MLVMIAALFMGAPMRHLDRQHHNPGQAALARVTAAVDVCVPRVLRWPQSPALLVVRHVVMASGSMVGHKLQVLEIGVCWTSIE